MKQLLILAGLCLLLAAAASSKPVTDDKKPAPHKKVDDGRRDFMILPDTKTGAVTLRVINAKAGTATVVVLNGEGNIMIRQDIMLNDGKNKISLPGFSNLQEGSYTVYLNSSYKNWHAAFLLWK